MCMRLFLLLGSLPGGQGGGYRAARLDHIEELLFISGWCYQTLVLVTPHHQVKKVIQELLRNVVSGSVLTPRKKKIDTKYITIKQTGYKLENIAV